MIGAAIFPQKGWLAALVAAGFVANSLAADWQPSPGRRPAPTSPAKQSARIPAGKAVVSSTPASKEELKATPEIEETEELSPIELTAGEEPEIFEAALPAVPGADDETSAETSVSEDKAPAALDPKGNSVPLEDASPVPLFQHLWGESSLDWVFRDGADGLGSFSMKNASSRELDFFDDPSKFTGDFRYGLHFLSGPDQPDMPPRLYDLYWNVRWLQHLGDGWGFDANFDLGLFTDFEDSVREGWRFPGRALGFWKLNGEEGPSPITLTAGIEYFDMDNIGVLPAGGVILQPDEDTRLELYFPRPQAKFRIQDDEKDEVWWYVRGDLIGSAWAMERTTGNADVANLLERRVSVGLETKSKEAEGHTSFIELGYLFHRELEYRSGVGSRDLGDTLTFRFGSRY